MNRKVIRNGRILTPWQSLDNQQIVIEDGLIREIISDTVPIEDAEVIDAAGLYVAPGFVEVHVQGTKNRDVWEVQTDGVQGLADVLPEFGCTAFLPTTHYEEGQVGRIANRIQACKGGARVLGLHLEGPFIHPDKRGALSPQTDLEPSRAGVERIFDITRGQLKMMTLSPELPGCLEVVQALAEKGVVPSVGHTDSPYDAVLKAADYGLSHATHCFNAMRPLSHREPGSVGACLLCDRISVQIVSDNHHLHPAMYDLVARTKPWEKIVLVTDAVRAAGMPPGKYESEGHGKVIVLQEGKVTLENGTIAGSALTANVAIKNFQAQVKCPMHKAVQLFTVNPAKVLGLENQLGEIAASRKADIVLFDDDYRIHRTLIDGKSVYSCQCD